MHTPSSLTRPNLTSLNHKEYMDRQMKSLTLSAPVSVNSTTTALLSTVLVLVRGFTREQGGSGVATRSSRITLACNPSAREAEQQDRVPSRRRLHRQALPLKHNADRPKGSRRSTLPHSGPGGTNLSPRNRHKTGLEFAEILLSNWVTCPCLKPTTASIQSGWMEKQ